MNQNINARNIRFIQRRPYFIPIQFLNVAAGATVTLNRAVDIGDLNFVWTHLGARATGGQAFSLTIRDVGGNVDFQNAPFDIGTIKGTEDRPFELPQVWLFLSKSGVYAEVTNNGTVQDTLDISLIGYLDPEPDLQKLELL